MSVSKAYSPKEAEEKWYPYWMDKGFFSSKPNPDKEPYTIVIPPPNVTGMLHMGHMLNNTIQDILIRKARMEGKEACWVPGTDHASIATETKVVALLKEQGIDKKDLSREDFLSHAWEWKEKYGGIILEQLKRLGASCDWDRTKFTMDEDLSEAVKDVFVRLHEKGMIYRGVRMVNWDPQGLTAVSDEEVYHKEVNSKLYHIKYQVEGSKEFLVVATTRPETLLGDTAVCINPNDERFTHLKGKKAIVPFVNRVIPIIEDEYVDIEFGTGCLKVTPAHDINDYELGLKHNLEVIDIINDNGTLSEAAQYFVGEDRFVARKKIAKELEEKGLLVKLEEITNKVGYSERTNAVIEPKLSAQWFCKMEDLSKPALENVMNDNIKLHPPKFKNMYRSWLENVKDWCISRQLWWGHRIPAYYLPNGQVVVAKSDEEALIKAQAIDSSITASDLKQDEDVLDTWFSSWLWPMSVFDGINNPENEEIKYYYPTNDLVTGFDIIFFWVARMIIAGYEYKGEMPFKNVYFTGMVRDEKGRKMSKQLGNSPDPLLLMDKYGTDGVRVGMLLAAAAGNDLLFDEKLCEQGRNFSNKIWNSYRLISGWEIDESLACSNETAISWFDNKFNAALEEIEDHFSKYRISDALMTTYKLVWDDFCSWYLEMIKPKFGEKIDPKTVNVTLTYFEKLLKVLHPYMPFITEELWHSIKERTEMECLIVAEWPKQDKVDTKLIQQGKNFTEIVSAIRNIKNEKQINPKDEFDLAFKAKDKTVYSLFKNEILKLSGAVDFDFVEEKPEGATAAVVEADEIFVTSGAVDVEQEKESLVKELEYTKGFLASVTKKLSNERFVNNAPPQVVDIEIKKKEDAEKKIKVLEENLASLV